MKKVKEIIPYVIILIVILLIKHYVVTTIRVNGGSMENTLLSKDIMILDKLDYKINKIERFDIIVAKVENDSVIKRIIGLPNETVKYEDNELYINGKRVKDPYNRIEQDDFEISLNKNEYFVMGDNREVSLDSRFFGPVNKKQILGHAKFTIYPFNRWGAKK